MKANKVMDFFDFDEPELYANRNGRLTQRQLETLKADDASTNAFARNVGIALIVGSLIGMGILFRKISFDASLFGLAGCLAPILIGAFFIRIGMKKPSFTLVKAEGRVNFVIEKSYSATLERETSAYVMHIGEASFEVESEAAGFIQQGDVYCVYYIEETDQIMSLEKINAHSASNANL